MKSLPYPSTLVRLLTKFVCVSLFTGLFACEQVAPVPESELVHINNGTSTVKSTATMDTMNHQQPRPSVSLADSSASTPRPHIDPQPKKPDQSLI